MKQLVGMIAIIVLSVCLNGCTDETSVSANLADYIPNEATLVLKSNDLEILRKDLKQNEAFSPFRKSELFKLIAADHPVLQHLKPKGPSILSVIRRGDSLLDYAFVSKKDSTLFVIDSLQNKSSETLRYNNLAINRITLSDKTVFTAIRDSVFIASSSQPVLQDLLSGKRIDQSATRKALGLNKGAELTILRKDPEIILQDSSFSNVTRQIALNVTIAANGITAAGVAMAKDSSSQLIDVFRGQIPQQNTLVALIPTDAKSAVTFTFNNAPDLMNKLRKFRADSIPQQSTALFETITEVGDFYFSEGNAIALSSIDGASAREALDTMVSENSNFRDVTIYTFTQPDLFVNSLSPLIGKTRPGFAFRLDDYFVFSETLALAEKIITAYKSNDVVLNTEYYKLALRQLGNSSSLNVIHLNGEVVTGLSNLFSTGIGTQTRMEVNKKYPISVMQFSYDRDFAHVNFVCLEAGDRKQISGRLTQLTSKKMEANILGEVKFFSNHRTGGQDIVVQDFENRLHLIAANGNTLWTKQLPGPIIGEVEEVDLLRNGKKQLAFTTRNKFHILDRNGKAVAPFPIGFKDPITRPLSVFDYDNNRNYRFAIVQGREIRLYDSQGKVVTGFKFKKAGSDIVQAVQHFRIGNKDYIVIAEDNGTLNILNRVGATRIPVSKKFGFSEIPITTEASNFVVITSENTKVSISTSGKLSSKNLKVSGDYWFTSEAKIKVTLDDNLMRIDGKLVELPFGIYTRPQIQRVNRKTHISITETQEKKVYLYDSNATLIPGFPVYGTSAAELGDVNRNGKLNLLVKGAENETILYQLE